MAKNKTVARANIAAIAIKALNTKYIENALPLYDNKSMAAKTDFYKALTASMTFPVLDMLAEEFRFDGKKQLNMFFGATLGNQAIQCKLNCLAFTKDKAYLVIAVDPSVYEPTALDFDGLFRKYSWFQDALIDKTVDKFFNGKKGTMPKELESGVVWPVITEEGRYYIAVEIDLSWQCDKNTPKMRAKVDNAINSLASMFSGASPDMIARTLPVQVTCKACGKSHKEKRDTAKK